jgi:hypothetical protein
MSIIFRLESFLFDSFDHLADLNNALTLSRNVNNRLESFLFDSLDHLADLNNVLTLSRNVNNRL